MPWPLVRSLWISVVVCASGIGLGQPIGTVTTLAGSSLGNVDGVGTAAQFYIPSAVAVDVTGTIAVVADFGSYVIRRINVTSAQVTTLAGTPFVVGAADGIGTAASFNAPYGIAIDATGTVALVVRLE